MSSHCLPRTSFRDQAAATIRAGIAAGEYEPGELYSVHEHREILDALQARRAGDVVELTRAHLEHIRGIWAGRPETD